MKRKAQSIIEVMLAIAVISMAMVGFLSLSANNVTSGRESAMRNQAVLLAEEGIEAVRNIRDSNWLAGCSAPGAADCKQWNSGLSSALNYRALPQFEYPTNAWTLQFINATFDSCVIANTCKIYQSVDNIYSNKNIGTMTPFSRMVEINPICDDPLACGGDGICITNQVCPLYTVGLQVISRVRWTEKGKTRNVVIEERLFNWR
jgi:Tfp pilus assembly protein PilV